MADGFYHRLFYWLNHCDMTKERGGYTTLKNFLCYLGVYLCK